MIKDFEFKGNDDGAVVTKYCGNSEIVKVPAYINDRKIVGIGKSCFEGQNIKAVIVPNTVKYIKPYAFRDCNSLTCVTVPNSVTNIDDYAFYGCSSLTSITMPDNITSLGFCAFNGTGYYNNPSNWENGVLYIDNCLVDENDVPQNYKINEGTRVIADYAFSGCSLKSVTIPDSVTSIGKSAFAGCDSLTSVTIPNSVTSIGKSAFLLCDSLTDIYILNKNCDIVSSSENYYTIPVKTTIHGYKSSTAEAYAKKSGNKFTEIKI